MWLAHNLGTFSWQHNMFDSVIFCHIFLKSFISVFSSIICSSIHLLYITVGLSVSYVYVVLSRLFSLPLFSYFHSSLPIILSVNLYISLLILEVLYQIVELFSVSSIPRPLPPTLPLSLFLFPFPLPLYGICFTFLFYTIFHFSFISTTAPKPPNGSHPTLKPVRSRIL